MRYAGLMVAALESTLGDSFGLAERPGFAQTGDFALHAVGPFGAAFNFGDSEPRFDMAPLAWFAHRSRRDAQLIDRYDGWFLAVHRHMAQAGEDQGGWGQGAHREGVPQQQSRMLPEHLVERPGGSPRLSCDKGRQHVRARSAITPAARGRLLAQPGRRRQLHP